MSIIDGHCKNCTPAAHHFPSRKCLSPFRNFDAPHETRTSHRNVQVIATCRNPSAELSSLSPGVQVISGVDVATDEGVKQLQKAIGDTKIDLLLNNAGILAIEASQTIKILL